MSNEDGSFVRTPSYGERQRPPVRSQVLLMCGLTTASVISTRSRVSHPPPWASHTGKAERSYPAGCSVRTLSWRSRARTGVADLAAPRAATAAVPDACAAAVATEDAVITITAATAHAIDLGKSIFTFRSRTDSNPQGNRRTVFPARPQLSRWSCHGRIGTTSVATRNAKSGECE